MDVDKGERGSLVNVEGFLENASVVLIMAAMLISAKSNNGSVFIFTRHVRRKSEGRKVYKRKEAGKMRID